MASLVETVVMGYQVLLEEMGRMENKETEESLEWRVQLVSVVCLDLQGHKGFRDCRVPQGFKVCLAHVDLVEGQHMCDGGEQHVQMLREHSLSTKEELLEPGSLLMEEEPTTSVSQNNQNTYNMEVELRVTVYMGLSTSHTVVPFQLLLNTMSPVLCATCQPEQEY